MLHTGAANWPRAPAMWFDCRVCARTRAHSHGRTTPPVADATLPGAVGAYIRCLVCTATNTWHMLACPLPAAARLALAAHRIVGAPQCAFPPLLRARHTCRIQGWRGHHIHAGLGKSVCVCVCRVCSPCVVVVQRCAVWARRYVFEPCAPACHTSFAVFPGVCGAHLRHTQVGCRCRPRRHAGCRAQDGPHSSG